MFGLSSSFLRTSLGFRIFDMLAIIGSVPSGVEEDEKLQPRGSSSFRFSLDRCPLSSLQKRMDPFVEVLAVCKPMLSLYEGW